MRPPKAVFIGDWRFARFRLGIREEYRCSYARTSERVKLEGIREGASLLRMPFEEYTASGILSTVHGRATGVSIGPNQGLSRHDQLQGQAQGSWLQLAPPFNILCDDPAIRSALHVES
jgi:hypothetical protein